MSLTDFFSEKLNGQASSKNKVTQFIVKVNGQKQPVESETADEAAKLLQTFPKSPIILPAQNQSKKATKFLKIPTTTNSSQFSFIKRFLRNKGSYKGSKRMLSGKVSYRFLFTTVNTNFYFIFSMKNS